MLGHRCKIGQLPLVVPPPPLARLAPACDPVPGLTAASGLTAAQPAPYKGRQMLR